MWLFAICCIICVLEVNVMVEKFSFGNCRSMIWSTSLGTCVVMNAVL